jgi:hypothetical protein
VLLFFISIAYVDPKDEQSNSSKPVEDGSKIKKPFAFFPLIQSNPVLDFAVGAGVSYLYSADEES